MINIENQRYEELLKKEVCLELLKKLVKDDSFFKSDLTKLLDIMEKEILSEYELCKIEIEEG